MLLRGKMEIQLEQTILRNLLTNDDYARKAAFITPDYFEGVYKGLFKEFTKSTKYNRYHGSIQD